MRFSYLFGRLPWAKSFIGLRATWTRLSRRQSMRTITKYLAPCWWLKHQDRWFTKAYGNRALVPTLHDAGRHLSSVASLTKGCGNNASIMKLFEQGKIRIAGRVTDYLPGVSRRQQRDHRAAIDDAFSGLRMDGRWNRRNGYQTGIEKALHDKPANPPLA